jgi:hypothetical protein
MNASLNIEAMQVQLTNNLVTSPAIIRLFQEHIEVDIVVPDGKIGIDIGLVDSKIRLVLRNYTGDNEIKPQVMTLYDFRESEER